MKKCSYCSAQIADGSLFCEVCGKKQPQGRVCSQCGMPINDGDVFCETCGHKIEEEVKAAAAPVAEVAPVGKKCPHCGSALEEEDVFCQTCGKKIDVPEEESATPAPETPFYECKKTKETQRLSKPILIIVSIVLMIVSIVLMVVVLDGLTRSCRSAAQAPAADSEELIEQPVRGEVHDADEYRSFQKQAPKQIISVANLEFSGYINEKYEIAGTLDQDGNSVSGRYYYALTMRRNGDKPSTWISLSGTIDDDGNAHLTGTASNGAREVWTGKFEKDYYGRTVFHGTFYGSNGKNFSISFSKSN